MEATVLLLAAIASRIPHTDGPIPPDAGRLAAAADQWRAALAACLPSGASRTAVWASSSTSGQRGCQALTASASALT
ncbi:hypothetical protein, partial [Streptomyces sp. NPDC005167]